ncbi:hypothetical protein ACEN8K_34965, partial [Variovorax sp. CT11-76]
MSDTTVPVPALQRIRADVRAMHAYAVQDARGLVKLDAMENPFGLPPALAAQAIASSEISSSEPLPSTSEKPSGRR